MKIFQLFSTLTLLLFFCLPGMRLPEKKEYLSITSSNSARGFKTLGQAYLEINQSHLKPAGILTTPIDLDKLYHMTLIGFDVCPISTITDSQKASLKLKLTQALEEATRDAIKNTLNHLESKAGKPTPMTLRFAYLGVFKKKIVGIFEVTPVIQKFVDTIENYFHNNIKRMNLSGLISKIQKHQSILQPHVSVATITNKHTAYGAGFTPKIKVSDFLITKPDYFVSAQWRQ